MSTKDLIEQAIALPAMSYRFHPEAAAELNQSIDHYELIAPGLG